MFCFFCFFFQYNVLLFIFRALSESRAISRQIHISNQVLERALASSRPSALKDIAIETPGVYWSHIGGYEEVKQSLKEAVEWPISSPEVFENMGIRAPKVR